MGHNPKSNYDCTCEWSNPGRTLNERAHIFGLHQAVHETNSVHESFNDISNKEKA